jgi:hypothetical protein
MTSTKKSHPHDREQRISTETAHLLSKEQRNKEKSEATSYAHEDKRKVAREEHINGSTPKSSL